MTEQKQDIINLIVKKAFSNLDSLFNFTLTEKEFKLSYGFTKKEIKEVLK